MSGEDGKYKFFKITRFVLIVLLAVSILTSLLFNKSWGAFDNFIFFLLGIHILLFLGYWIEWSVKMMEDYLKGKPEWYQKGLAIKKNPLFTKIFFVVTAILCILSFILSLI